MMLEVWDHKNMEHEDWVFGCPVLVPCQKNGKDMNTKRIASAEALIMSALLRLYICTELPNINHVISSIVVFSSQRACTWTRMNLLDTKFPVNRYHTE